LKHGVVSISVDHLLLPLGGERQRFFRTPSSSACDSRLFIKLVRFSRESDGLSISKLLRGSSSS
jgi:hypothetical protein